MNLFLKRLQDKLHLLIVPVDHLPKSKNEGKNTKIKKTGDSRYIYQNELRKGRQSLLST